jgi:hypothetical protein
MNAKPDSDESKARLIVASYWDVLIGSEVIPLYRPNKDEDQNLAV